MPEIKLNWWENVWLNFKSAYMLVRYGRDESIKRIDKKIKEIETKKYILENWR